jgi:ABC-type branched-subunit amino acid transport system substrate-binding protein
LTYVGTECEHPQVTARNSRRTRARALVAVAAVLTVSATAACSSSSQSGAVQHSTLTVVSFNPFTGPDASFGPEMEAGCQSAARSVNAAGGVLGNKVACSAVDTRGDPADAVTGAAKMLATTSHLFGVLGPSSDEADSTAPLINAAKVPMFADTGEASFDHNTLPYFWRMVPADDVRSYAMALYAHQKGYTRAAAVFGNDIGSQAGVPALMRGYSELGGDMVINQKLALNQASYQSEVEALIAAKPQVIFTETSPQANATYLAELQQLGHLIPVVGTDVTIQPQYFTAMAGAIGKNAASQYFVAESPYAATSGPGWSTFNHNLLASSAAVPKPSQWSTDSYSMTDYDSVIVMALAATAANSTTPSVYNKYITAVTTPSSGATQVHTYADGVAALKAGKKIYFAGASGVIDFNQWHNSGGGFEIAAYQANGNLNLIDAISAAQLAPLIK